MDQTVGNCQENWPQRESVEQFQLHDRMHFPTNYNFNRFSALFSCVCVTLNGITLKSHWSVYCIKLK